VLAFAEHNRENRCCAMKELPVPHSAAFPEPALVVRDDVPLAAVPAPQWDALAMRQPMLSALHETGCAVAATGWRPRYLTAWRGARLVGALPLYAKTHSQGEYVFDWAWADAFRRYGQRYYPKLVAAIPFTPTPGPRLLAPDETVRRALLRHALAMVKAPREAPAPMHSSLHVLFPTPSDAVTCAHAGMIVRHGVQFHWENSGYRDFADFLAALSHDKRKKVKQERRRLAEAGVDFVRKVGREITAADWAFFYRCYENTYRAHHSTPYLSADFFERIGATMPEHLLLVLGQRGGRRLCAALDIFDAKTLWGRYWGTAEYVPGLHFEACYYQAIEFCIERSIVHCEGGAQGVHKLARGFLPVTTYSAHAIADPGFARAIADFCARERTDVAHAVGELEDASPFRRVADEKRP
jgi:predicted N-acyltransferase